MKKILISFLALCATATMFAAEKVYDTNFALQSNGATATASSGSAKNAIDGNNGTRWESASTDTEWFVLNLGQARIFNTIQIRWEGAYTEKFTLSASSDSANWTLLGDTINRKLAAAGNYEEQIEFAETTAQYIRFQTYKRATGWGNSFWEFRVLLPGVATLTTLDATVASPLCKVGQPDAITISAKDQNGSAMDPGTVTYTVSPADAGTVANGVYTPAKAGLATITAAVGTIQAQAVTVFAYAGENVILSATLPDSKVIAQNNENPNGSDKDAFFAIDPNEGSIWQGDPVATNASMETECWFVADLGAYYDIELVTIKFEGACSQNYTVDFSADNVTWVNGYTHVGNAGVNGRTDMIYPGADKDLQNTTKVRYFRFKSTKNATQYGMKIYDLKVYGTAWVPSSDTEAPVMGAAALVSNTHNSAVISVAATDNQEVKDYHVVDAANSIDTYKAATDGKITVTGLAASTTYNFTITARDLALNESANSATVAVTTAAHYDRPQAAATAPTVVAARVIKVFSDAYTGADFRSLHGQWGDPTVFEAMSFGEDNVRLYNNINYFGWEGAAINALNMEKLHLDIWAEDNGQVGIVPIYGGAGLTTDDSKRKIVALVGQQWNSIDLDLATDFAGLNLASIFQFKFDSYQGAHMALDNVYFYRTSDLVDTEAPQALVASLVSADFFGCVITATATDNMGAVIYTVKNGEAVVGTKSAVSGEATQITVTGLIPGTAYNLSVIASDASENESAPATVAVTTTAAPAAAPAPAHEAEYVVSLYSDAYTFAPASLKSYNEGWWDNPTLTQAEIATGEHVLYYTGRLTGMIGWEYAKTNVYGYTHVHVDIYPLQSGSIKVGPTMKLDEVNVVANQWNSFDIDLTTVDSAALAGMFQFEMIAYSSIGNFFVDNVYFWKEAPVEEITWELNGGQVVAVAPADNQALWEDFMTEYNAYTNEGRATQTIDNAAVFCQGGTVNFMTQDNSPYKWLGDYILGVVAEANFNNGALTTPVLWRFNVKAFFNCGAAAASTYNGNPDFTVAGQPAAWQPAYLAAHTVVLPATVSAEYTIPTPTKEDCTFEGWYDNAEFTGDAYTTITPADNGKTFYAKWSTTPTSFEVIETEGVQKLFIDGQLFIIRGGHMFNAAGQLVK